jgi:WD40 repeat protein/serine/threonine protein kinase
LLLETARQIGRQPPEIGAAFRQVLRSLRESDPLGGPPTGPGGSEVLNLSFLTPSAQPGHLGRLGHYEVTEVLGRGGMGVVFKAHDEKLQRMVAIKVLAPHLATSAWARQRFLREVRAAAAIRHEHVIDIHAVEEANGHLYLVMEYVSGQSLQERLDACGPLPLLDILRIGMQMAQGLAAAHAQGVIHRDIKPANVLLENGVARVKITDFGLARAGATAGPSQEGVVAGTPQYMAPEQARGEPVDPRADLFSLGSVLYAMTTGIAPFAASSALAVLKCVCDEKPRPIQDINPQVPRWLCELIEKLHAKGPAKRIQSASEVADLLGKHLADLQLGRRLPSPRLSLYPLCRWATAAALLLLLLGGLSVTEATGITRVVPTVIHIVQGDGSLIVEVDDPQVRVTVEGDGGLVITGAGPHEVRLRPGNYHLRASKDGKTVREELITLMRGDRQVVRVSRESGPPVGASIAAGTPATAPNHRFEGHTGPILSLAFSLGGRYALSGSVDKTVRLWDMASGRELQCFEGHTDEVTAVAFSPKGKEAVSSGGDRMIRLWDLEKGRQLAYCRGHTGKVHSLSFSTDGRLIVSGSADKTVRLWHTSGGAIGEGRSFTGHQGCVTSVAISPDGRLILSGSHDGSVRIWDRASGKELHSLEGHTREVYAVAFAPDGRRAASGSNDKTVRLWDVDHGKELHCLSGHENAVICVAFGPEGRQIFSASSQYQVVDRTLRVWDAASGRLLRSFGGADTDRVSCAAFFPEGRLALSGSAEATLRLWKLSP